MLGWRSFAHNVNSLRKLSLEQRADKIKTYNQGQIKVAHISYLWVNYNIEHRPQFTSYLKKHLYYITYIDPK